MSIKFQVNFHHTSFTLKAVGQGQTTMMGKVEIMRLRAMEQKIKG